MRRSAAVGSVGRDAQRARLIPANAAFFGLAFTALNPKQLGADLLIIENRRPRAMIICFLAGGLGMSLTIGILDVLFVQADAVKTQGRSARRWTWRWGCACWSSAR